MSRPVSETCPVCGTPGRIVGGDEGTQHFEPEAAWVSPAVTRRAEIAERKALAALLGEAWLAHDLANDAYLAEAVPRPTVEEYAEFAAAIAAALAARGVRVGDEGLREAPLLAALETLTVEFQNAEGLNDGLRRMWIATVRHAIALAATPTPPEIDVERNVLLGYFGQHEIDGPCDCGSCAQVRSLYPGWTDRAIAAAYRAEPR